MECCVNSIERTGGAGRAQQRLGISQGTLHGLGRPGRDAGRDHVAVGAIRELEHPIPHRVGTTIGAIVDGEPIDNATQDARLHRWRGRQEDVDEALAGGAVVLVDVDVEPVLEVEALELAAVEVTQVAVAHPDELHRQPLRLAGRYPGPKSTVACHGVSLPQPDATVGAVRRRRPLGTHRSVRCFGAPGGSSPASCWAVGPSTPPCHPIPPDRRLEGVTAAVARSRRVAASRDEAVTAFFTEHHVALLRLAGLLLHDGQVAEDVVQDAFARFYVAYPRLRESDASLAYLRRTVVNLCHSRLRRLGVARRNRGDVMRVAESADATVGLRDDQVAVVRALAELSDRQRTCLVLRFYQDLTEVEIAAVLGVSPNSVKTHVQRGMAALAERFEERR